MAAADYRLLTEATGQRMATALENIAEGGELEIADAYSSSATYAVGDYCIYNNTLYKCSTAITTAEAWTPAHWTATTVTAELKGKLGPGDVVNNLTNGGTTVPLSAEMGKLANTSEDHQITRVGSYFTERSAFKARRLWGTVIIFSYVQITTQVPATTAFADIGISNAEGIFSFVSGGTSHIVTCSGGILKPDEALPTGYYYVVGSALAKYT